MQTILSGTSFLRCTDGGDIGGIDGGWVSGDERQLSRLELAVDGAPVAGAVDAVPGEHWRMSFVQPSTVGVVVRREYLITLDALHMRIELATAPGAAASTHDVALTLATDRADIFAIKRAAFAATDVDAGTVGTGATSAQHAFGLPPFTSTRAPASRTPADEDGTVRVTWRAEVTPSTPWVLDLAFAAGDALTATGIASIDDASADARAEHARLLAAVPQLTGPTDIATVWQASLEDLAALRIPWRDSSLIAAGCPWFLTVFGRDTLITCLQTMLLGPERAIAALEYLAEYRAASDDPQADAEPGKIMHEMRQGALADGGYDVYYGSADATPLFLMLLDAVHRWTLDDGLVREHQRTADRAIGWITDAIARDPRGFITFERRSPQGLDVQSWKDSHDSQRFHDGTQATGPIAAVEVQAYAWAALTGMARLTATVFGDAARAAELRAAADALRDRFLSAFVDPDTHHIALALDGDGRRVDATTSNIGHVLWSGILDGAPDVAAAAAASLAAPDMASGWGVRTMSTRDAAYDPVSYHNGSVWPHDTSIVIAGLARARQPDAAAALARDLLDAAIASGGRLPEVMSGAPRDRALAGATPEPYATTCSPQAWAAGAPMLALTSLLGLQVDVEAHALVSTATVVPAWLDGLAVTGIPAVASHWNVTVSGGEVLVGRAASEAAVL